MPLKLLYTLPTCRFFWDQIALKWLEGIQLQLDTIYLIQREKESPLTYSTVESRKLNYLQEKWILLTELRLNHNPFLKICSVHEGEEGVRYPKICCSSEVSDYAVFFRKKFHWDRKKKKIVSLTAFFMLGLLLFSGWEFLVLVSKHLAYSRKERSIPQNNWNPPILIYSSFCSCFVLVFRKLH